MALTLNEYGKMTRDPLTKAVIRGLIRQSKILQMLPIQDVPGLQVTSVRWQTLPTSGVRNLNEAYSESTGKTENVTDTLHIYGGDIKVDRVLTLAQTTTENPLQTQTEMKIAAVAADVSNDFINGDHAVDPKRFEGIKKRVTNAPSRMTVDLSSSGDSLKVLASADNIQTFLDALHRLLKVVDAAQGGNVALLMNENTYLGIGAVLRRAGLNTTQTDAYDREWDAFGKAKLVDIGLKGDQTTEIITSTEDPGDGGNDATSIYAVRFGGVSRQDASGKVSVMDDDGLRMIQLKGTKVDPYDPHKGGEGGEGVTPAIIRRIDWVIGLEQKGKYSVARLSGFKMAAS